MAGTKRKRKKRRDSLVLQLIIMVTLVLVVFEGKLVVTMITHRSSMRETVVTDGAAADNSADGTVKIEETSADTGRTDERKTKSEDGASSVLAGLPTAVASSGSLRTASVQETNAPEKKDTVSNPNSKAIVPPAEEPVDDSYFSDAAFIGDSRMQGFQNASGITQGTFFTSVGMSLSTMEKEKVIQTAEGNITVAAALSGRPYKKIYIMLGANDLGEYDWNAFRDGFISCTERFREIQPDAIIYICSVIYVEEAKVTTGSYVNNVNVDKINSILLEICEQEGYQYLDLNEILSNGYGSLIEGASSDGVHIYPQYCEMMLDYLKNHYIESDTEDTARKRKEADGETETETETAGSADAA